MLIIACGALAHEIVAVKRANGWRHVTVQCLPADLHNRPERIPGLVRERIRAARGTFDGIFVAYADCGTGGLLDAVLEEEGVERLPGAHCYEFYAGARTFARLAEEELGTFYLTDFLARHFERLVVAGLGIDRHPQLAGEYFRNYRRIVYLAQTDDPDLDARARAAAARLGLDYERVDTGHGELDGALSRAVAAPVAVPAGR